MPGDDSDLHVGRVILVGAGPGDPGLLTLRGLESLRRADVVLHDYLVNPQILEHARPDAELVCLGQHGRGKLLSQAEINARMIAAARAGKLVVRIKGGDPTIFARLADEIEALSAAGIPFEIVPGVTTALAAAAYAGIPLTQRDRASAVALVTGREAGEKSDPALDFAALANFPGTLVFHMGITTARHWSAVLLAAGKPAATPVAIVRRCSWPDQSTVLCRLDDVADVIAAHRIRPPAIIIIGDVVELEPVTRWFTSRPLFGRRIVVTRAAGQANELRDRLQDLGAVVNVQPAIEIAPPGDWAPLDAALRDLSRFDWVVFSSANGVRAVANRLWEIGGDGRWFGGVKLAAIGPGTADELTRCRLRADLTPPEFRAESLAAALAPHATNRRFLLIRANRGREVLADELRAAGGRVEQVVAYQSNDVREAEPEIAELLASGQVDFVTVTSSAIARSLVNLFGDALCRTRLASISPVTSATLRELGFQPAVEASEYTIVGLVSAILSATD